jgi:rare lipoprotein A
MALSMNRKCAGSRRSQLFLWFGTSILLFSVACSVPPSTIKVPGSRPPAGAATQSGIASWYGPGFHGRPTASGDIYNQYDLTAAHQTLPLGTKVMVTNLDNGSSAEVVINDRGPFAKGRIIDLSYAAARMLGMIGPGTIPVRIEVIDGGPHNVSLIPSRLDYTLQAGSFVSADNARRLRERLAAAYPRVSQVSIVSVQGTSAVYYRVQMGTFADREEAEGHARQLARLGFPTIIVEK